MTPRVGLAGRPAPAGNDTPEPVAPAAPTTTARDNEQSATGSKAQRP
jgi:hypothetical protein